MNWLSCYKLLITVVKKGKAKDIIKASRKAGAEGGTIFYGSGTGIYEKKFLGMPVNQEKEIIFTLFDQAISDELCEAVIKAGRLLETGQGIAMVIDTCKAAGIAHSCQYASVEREKMEGKKEFELIVTIVNKGNSEGVIAASKRAGAEGGTILNGRGTGYMKKKRFSPYP